MKGITRLVLSSLLVVVFGAMSFLAACGPAKVAPSPGAPAVPEAIKVGHLGEWTGPAGRTCGPPGDALLAYWKYVNEEKGGIPYCDPDTGKVIGKVKVEPLWADCRYEPPLYKSAYKRFRDAGVVLFHCTSSPGIEALKPDLKRDKIPMFQTSANCVAMWPPEWIFGHRPSFSDDPAVLTDFFMQKFGRPIRIALMYYDGPFGKTILWGAPQYAISKGCKIVASEPVPPMPVSMETQLMRIKEAKADVIISTILGSQAAVILKDMQRLGIDIPISITTCTDAAELSELAGDAAEGCYYVFPADPLSDETYPSRKWVNENYRKYMKGKAGYDVVRRPYPDGVWNVGWTSGVEQEECIRLALEKVSPAELTGATLRDYGIARMDNFDMNGIQKMCSFKGKIGLDHRGSEYTMIHQVVNSLDTAVTGWFLSPCILTPWMEPEWKDKLKGVVKGEVFVSYGIEWKVEK